MSAKRIFKTYGQGFIVGWILLLFLTACQQKRGGSPVETGIQNAILHLGNGTEPKDLDPHLVTGVPEQRILLGLFEGLVSEDPRDLHPVPGVAERWQISPDGAVYTFHLRAEAKWSNNQKVTAHDFVRSYERILSPALRAENAYLFFAVKNAEAYFQGKRNHFDEVGFKALDDATLEIKLEHPVPYFLSLMTHFAWFPVPVAVIAQHGDIHQRGNRWTQPPHLVGNGPFILKEWKFNQRIVLEKNPRYWDANQVRLKEIHFYPIEQDTSEELAFRLGQLHVSLMVPFAKISEYQSRNPRLLRLDPWMAVYFYRINVTHPILRDRRVRRALALAIDRETLVRTVTRGGEQAAYHFVPPNLAGYQATARVPTDLAAAKQLLADAGHPEGRGLPPIEILFPSGAGHSLVAEAIQQMLKTSLNVQTRLFNQEFQVFLQTQNQLNYQISSSGWKGDYLDPQSFLSLWLSTSVNNRTGWRHPEYDRLLEVAARTTNRQERFALLQKAEQILLDEAPIIPVYFRPRAFLIHPSVRGWHPNLLDNHPYKYLFLEPAGADM